ncbi:DUF4240 domain-containing protein [Actinoplanes sp. NPDC026619]|uniref:DUF4240 domain-containing protein n=1 Tax=Actinoplanes sp. NPDC026619 TaxID=3155798 RepID=UPI0033CC2B7C
MELDEFWELIGSRRTDDDFAALTDRLAERDAATITAFEDRLTELLYALDTPPHAKAARARGDWFLYVRCAAVAAGRDTYELVLEEPAKLRRFARREAELLLPVASTAYERSTGRPWDHETVLSYESGSNTEAWHGFPSLPQAAPAEPVSWLTTQTSNRYVARLAYVIGEDPAWGAWWSATGIAHCELQLAADGLDAVLVEPDLVTARASAAADSAPEAATVVSALFGAVRDRLELPEPPPAPDLSGDPFGQLDAWTADGEPIGLLRALRLIWQTRRAARRA